MVFRTCEAGRREHRPRGRERDRGDERPREDGGDRGKDITKVTLTDGEMLMVAN